MKEIIIVMICTAVCVLLGLSLGWMGSSLEESKARIKLYEQEVSKLICEKKIPPGQLCIIKAVPKKESK